MDFKYLIIFLIILIVLLIFVCNKNYFSGDSENFIVSDKHEYNKYAKFNPSIYYDGKYNHVLIRLSNLSPLRISVLFDIFIFKNKIKNYILYQKMNKELTEIYEMKIINIKYPISEKQKSIGMEDARIIYWKKSFYMYGALWCHPYETTNIALCKLSDKFDVEKITVFKEKNIQKNWISLIKDDELYFIKHICPFELYKYDENNDRAISVYTNKNITEEFKNIRGGSPCIPFEYKKYKGYLAITHKRNNFIDYKHQFIVFNGEYPFEPIWKSKDFIIDKNNKRGIEFACGLTQIDEKNVIVTFGRFDNYAKYKKYTFEEIFYTI